MKKIIGMALLFGMIASFTFKDVEASIETKGIYDSKTKVLKVYGDNSYGQLGISKATKNITKENAINVNDKIGSGVKVSYHSITKNNVFVMTSDGRLYISGSNNIGQLGYYSSADQEKFVKNPLVNKNNARKVSIEKGDNDVTGYYIVRLSDGWEIWVNQYKKNEYVFENDTMKNDIQTYKSKWYGMKTKKLYKTSNFTKSYKASKKGQLFINVIDKKYNSYGKLTDHKNIKSYLTKNHKPKTPVGVPVKNTTAYHKKLKYNKSTFVSSTLTMRNKLNKMTYYYSYKKHSKTKISKSKKIYKYAKNNKTLLFRYTYKYNRMGQLKSNKNGNAYRYKKSYAPKNKTIKQKYNSKGKLLKAKK